MEIGLQVILGEYYPGYLVWDPILQNNKEGGTSFIVIIDIVIFIVALAYIIFNIYNTIQYYTLENAVSPSDRILSHEESLELM